MIKSESKASVDVLVESQTATIIHVAKLKIPDLEIRNKKNPHSFKARFFIFIQVWFVWMLCKLRGDAYVGDNYSLVVDNKIYLADFHEANPRTKHIVVRHELVHLFDKKELGKWKFDLLWMFSWRWRQYFEFRAYCESLAARAWLIKMNNRQDFRPVKELARGILTDQAQAYTRLLRSSTYLWCGDSELDKDFEAYIVEIIKNLDIDAFQAYTVQSQHLSKKYDLDITYILFGLCSYWNASPFSLYLSTRFMTQYD